MGEGVAEAVLLRFIICLGALGLAVGAQRGMREGMLFWRYTLLLEYLSIKWRRKPDRWKRALLKPLGLCIYCYGFWAHFTLYLYFAEIETYPIFAGVYLLIVELWCRYAKD